MWYRTGSTIPQYRRAVSVDSSASAAAADAAFTLPPVLSEFWDAIDASGNELRVTDADGFTLLTYQLSGFSKTNRTGTVQLDNISAGVASVQQVWLYYGMSGAASAAGSFVYSASKAAVLYPGAPLDDPRPIRWSPQRPGDTRPRESRSKSADEVIWLQFDFGPALQMLDSPGDGQAQFEELDEVTYAVTLAGATQSGMVSASSVRYLGGGLVQVVVQGGASGSSYTVEVTARTTYPTQQTGRTLEARALLVVQDVSEV